MKILLTISTWLAVPACLTGQISSYSITPVDATCNTVAIAVDSAGNVYEGCNNSSGAVIKKVSSNGAATVVAGGGTVSQFLGDGGPATNAFLSAASGVAVDTVGEIYIADKGRIRKVAANGTISTIAGPGPTIPASGLGDGGPATNATISPAALALDAAGNLYIADGSAGGCRVRKLSPMGIITTAIGTGKCGYSGDGGLATNAQVSFPNAVDSGFLTLDSSGDIYFADFASTANVIRKVSTTGIITTIAGQGYPSYYGDGGPATLAGLSGVSGLTVDGTGNIYIADASLGPNYCRIQLITTDGNINTIAGPGTPITSPEFCGNVGINVGPLAWAGGNKIYLGYNGLALLAPTGKTFPRPGPSISTLRSPSAFQETLLTYEGQLGQGSWVEIVGNYLAADTRSWASADFHGGNAPTAIDGTSVTIGGQAAFISYVSPGQINAQVPANIGTGALPLIVTTASGVSTTLAATINPTEPALLAPSSFNIGGIQYAVALFSDGVTYVLPAGAIPGVPSRPAKAGDVITFYGVGFGPVSPGVSAGQITPGANSLTASFTMGFGSTSVYDPGVLGTVTYAGLAPGVVGLYQFNIVVPKLSYSGTAPITYMLGGSAQLGLPGGALYVALQ